MWALFSDAFAPIVDGVSVLTAGYAEYLQCNDDCVVVAPKAPHHVDNYPYPVLRVPSLKTSKAIGPYRLATPIAMRTIAKLKKMPLRLAHCHSPFSLSLLAKKTAQSCKIPSVYTYHTKYAQDFERTVPEKFRTFMQNFVVRRISSFDEVWAVSRGAALDLQNLGYNGDIHIMRNGCTMPTEPVEASLLQTVNRTHHLPENVPIFLFVGRMIWYKKIRLILNTLAQLQKDGRDFRMLFVGNGQDEKEIQNTCRAMGLAQHVIFVGAVRDRELLRAYYARADVFFFPSDFDTSGLVVQEAAALACPGVVLRGSCVAEGVTHGRNGLHIDDNAAQAARAISELLNAPQKLHDMGILAQREVYFSWQDAMNEVMARYEKIIAR
ncbi:MAG: glycosyltransferase [Oscillospiraceae bacterium]|nr:glycosyltransferase [Oscillospiraceae bacterium]